MVAYKVDFTPNGRESLGKLDKAVAQRVLDKIRRLSENIENIHPVSLKGEYSNVYKLRVGDWRVLYTFDLAKKVITIHLVRHRREIYRF